MKRFCFLHAITLICVTTLGQGKQDGNMQSPEDFAKRRFSDVDVKTDIQFSQVKDYKGNDTPLYLDIYEPKEDNTAARPVILWVHGGGFRTGSTRKQSYIVKYCVAFAKRGYVCISIDYRLRNGADMPDKASEFPALQDGTVDAYSAIEWVRSNAAGYRINPDCMFIAGGSAGGRIAATVSQFPGADGSWNKKGLRAAAILWGGPEPEMRGWLYPFLKKTGVPTVMIHGDADSTINVKNSIDLNYALERAGISSELNIIKGAPHTPGGKANELQIEDWVAGFFVKEWSKKADIKN
jgi:acetyl esterase/lipase